MKPTRSFSLALALVVAAPLCLAQRGTITRIAVLAPRNFVIAARTLQLTTRAANDAGATIRSRTFQWQTSDPTRASIDANGLLRGLSPGPVDVTASDPDSGVSGVVTLYVYPAKVAITSSAASVQTGDTLALSVQAQDADGNPLSGVPFQWFTDLPAIGGISSSGVLTGVAEGRVTVTAAIDMGPAFERFTAFTAIEVLRRADFRLKTLISSDAPDKGMTTLVPTRISAAGNFVAALTSLSNGGQALALSGNGNLQSIAVTGSMLAGHVVTRFESLSVNNVGDVLAIADTQSEWCEQILVLFSAASKWTPTIIDDTTRCSYSLTPWSLDQQGGIAFRNGNSLVWRKPDGTRQTIVSIGDHPPGVDKVNGLFGWNVTPFGKVLLEVQNTAGSSVYLAWDGTQLRKLFAAGDQVVDRLSQWARLPFEINPGEYITRIGGSNWSSISRLKDGAWSTVAMSGQNNIGWVQDNFDGSGNAVFFFADQNGKTALMRSNGSTTDVLGSYANWRELSQITATGGDSAVAFGTLGGTAQQALRFAGTSSTVVFGLGLPVDGAAGMGISQASIPKGINSASRIFKTTGDTLLRVTASGVSTLLKPGDPLGGNALTSLGMLASNRLGDVAFAAQHGPKQGLFAYRNGQFQLLGDTDDHIDGNAVIYGFATGNDSLVAMNNQGNVAVFAYTSSGYGIYLFSGAATAKNVMKVNAPAGSGALFTGVAQIGLDENGRIAFTAYLSTGRMGVFLWDQGNLRELLETGQNDPSGRVIQAINNLQAAGGKFYLRVGVVGAGEYLVLDGTSVKVLASDGYVATFGTTMTNCFGPEITANSRGDAVFPVLTPSGAALYVKRADGTDALAAIGSLRGPDGEWFLNIFGAGISEQGDIVFSALAWLNGHPRLALYQATPNN